MSNAQDKLAALRAKLLNEAASKGGGSGNTGGFDTRFYPFFLIDIDQSVTLRFIDDGDDKNPWFFKEKQMYEWFFADPENDGEQIKVRIPCRNMYREKSDPVLKRISDMFNVGGEEKEKARSVWVKKTYLYQGFVRKSPYTEETPPANPIRVFDISKQLHGTIYNSLIETDEDLMLPGIPSDADEGLNFTIKKFMNGEFKNYTGSFSTKPNELTDEERAAVEEHGAFNLSTLLPNEPSDEAYELLPEMLDACLAGDPWDSEWEKYWKPVGYGKKGEGEGEDTPAPVQKKKTAPMVKDIEAAADDTPTEAPMKASSTSDVLAKLRAKKAAQA